jgi:type IV pilus assembly protein PilA
MRKLFAKKTGNKKGFTLAELLIVVAIVAVLVAISIPVFTSKLEKAREATDVANMRAAKAAAVALYLDSDSDALTGGYGSGNVWAYDAANGKLVGKEDGDMPKAYGKGTSADGGTDYEGYKKEDTDGDHTKEIIKVTISDDTDDEGTVTIDWVEPSSIS